MKMTLTDGTVINNLELNGTNYVSQEEIDENIFEGNLKEVIVEDGESEYVLRNCELEYVRQYGDEWWFVLRELSDAEVKAMATDAQVLYTALVTDTLLEEE